jgi:hypothetical protein
LDTCYDAALSLSDVTEQIDQDLKNKNSPYEVAFFRVSGTLGIITGVNYDIHFPKTSSAKVDSEFVVIINPKTDSPHWKGNGPDKRP